MWVIESDMDRGTGVGGQPDKRGRTVCGEKQASSGGCEEGFRLGWGFRLSCARARACSSLSSIRPGPSSSSSSLSTLLGGRRGGQAGSGSRRRRARATDAARSAESEVSGGATGIDHNRIGDYLRIGDDNRISDDRRISVPKVEQRDSQGEKGGAGPARRRRRERS